MITLPIITLNKSLTCERCLSMRQEKPRILSFVPHWPASSSGVLHSTILTKAGYMQRNGLDCFFIGTDVSDEKAAEAEEYILQKYNIPSKIFGNYAQKRGFIDGHLFIKKIFRLSRNIIRDYQPTHIWVDCFSCSSVGRKIAHQQQAISVFDIQAIQAEEVALEHGRGIKYRICRWMEQYELKKSDRLAGVSYKIKQAVQDMTGRDDMTVVPCCFDMETFHFDEQWRKQIRTRYGFADDEKIICYSGGLSKWQRIPDVLKLCRQISKIRENFKFLLLTQQDEQLKQIAQENDLPMERCVIRSCLHKEVPRYLSAADVGIILRHDIPVNNVASPIKIGEYLGCGLPIILTKGIGDYSEVVSEDGVGIMLDENRDMAQQVVNFTEQSGFGELRDKAIRFAHKHISLDSYLDDIKRLFSLKHRQ